MKITYEVSIKTEGEPEVISRKTLEAHKIDLVESLLKRGDQFETPNQFEDVEDMLDDLFKTTLILLSKEDNFPKGSVEIEAK